MDSIKQTDTPTQNSPTMPTENTNTPRKTILILTGFIILILAVAMVFFLKKPQNEQSPTPNSEQTQQTAEPTTTATPEVAFNLSPTTQNVSIDDQFTIKLELDTKELAITGVDTTVTIDTTTAEFISFTPGNSLNVPLISEFDEKTKTYRFSAVDTSTTPVKGSLDLGTLTLRAQQAGSGQLSLQKSQVTASGRSTAIPAEIPPPASYTIK